MARVVKVAVIGSGLAGLTAAYLLSSQDTSEDGVEFEVHLFEKASTPGMDCSSVSLPYPGSSERPWRVEVPMRSFQGGYYPQLIALYKRLGVAFQAVDFTYSFSSLKPPSTTRTRQINATILYNGCSGTKGLGMPSMLHERYRAMKGQDLIARAFVKAWTTGVFVLLTMQITLCHFWMLVHAYPPWRRRSLERATFQEWARRTTPTSALARWIGLDAAWRHYTHAILLPLFSGVCTATEEDILCHPIEEILNYIWLTIGTHHYTVVRGVCDVVAKLIAKAQHVHLSSTVFSISPDPRDPHLASLHCNTPKGSTEHTGFHHLIFATQATRAIPLLSSYRDALTPQNVKRQAIEAQLQCLRAFEYRQTIVINHTDSSLMPDRPEDRRDLNFVSLDHESGIPRSKTLLYGSGTITVSSSYTMSTHILRPPADYPSHLPAVFQTTNPIILPKEDSVLSVAKLERAVLTVQSKEALKGLYKEEGRKWWQCAGQGTARLGELQGAGRLSHLGGPGIWICGSFAYTGIPLLEGCVVSARTVVEQGIGISEGLRPSTPPW